MLRKLIKHIFDIMVLSMLKFQYQKIQGGFRLETFFKYHHSTVSHAFYDIFIRDNHASFSAAVLF